MVKEIESDVFLAPAEIVVHQANCFHTMGSGIAAYIRQNFPEAYEADLKTVKGDREKLGTFSFARVVSKNPNPRLKFIINLYSQFDFGRENKHTLYDAMDAGLKAILDNLLRNNSVATIAIPNRIGSNLGGGDWNVVKAIIHSVFDKAENTVLICENPALTNQLLNKASK